jgi:hypothetical protein
VKNTETGLNSKIPGSNIDSWCGKCKMMLAHTIEAMVGDKPARVSCNTCRSQHAYKAQPPGQTGTRTVKRGANRYQSLLKAGESSVTKNYTPSAKFELGDVLEHPTFGGCLLTFFRLSFCANLLLRRFYSPGFRRKECFLTSLIMPSC